MPTTPTSSLTPQDKLGIVMSHIKNREYAIYNDELSVLEENSVTTPDTAAVSSVEARIADATAKLSALQTEKARLEALLP